MFMRTLCTVSALLCLLALPLKGQVAVHLAPVPAQQFLSSTGLPLSGGCVFSYISGTSTPQATYADSTGLIQNANPLILDSGGFGSIWLNDAQTYRITIKSSGGVNCASGTQQRQIDGVSNGSLAAILGTNNTWTGNQTYNGNVTYNGSVTLATLTVGGAETVNGALSATAGGALNGTFSGNAAFTGNNTFTGAPGITESNAGVFTNTQMNEYLQSLINGCSPQTEFQAEQGAVNATEGLVGCVTAPVGSTVNSIHGVAGYADTNAAASFAVAGYFGGRCLVNNSQCWGVNGTVRDVAGLTAGVVLAHEFDFNPQNGVSTYANLGLQSDLFAPVAGNYGVAYSANSSIVLPGIWGIGFSSSRSQVSQAAFWGALGTATNLVNFSGQPVKHEATYWTGSGVGQDIWQIQAQVGAGVNPFSVLNFSKTAGVPTASSVTAQFPAVAALWDPANPSAPFKFQMTTNGFVWSLFPSGLTISANRSVNVPDASGNMAVLPTAATTETGSGAIVRTTSPTITSPTFGTGVAADGSGHKHKRFGGVLGGTCPTAAAIGAACTSGNLNWTTGFADNSYTVTCSLVGSMTGQPHIVSLAYQAAGAGITLTIAADTAAATNVAAAGFVDCTADHD